MQSIVVLLVEHGDTTDPFTQMIDDAFFAKGVSVYNYEVAVDVDNAQADTALSTVLAL